jgi:hypothetical protein
MAEYAHIHSPDAPPDSPLDPTAVQISCLKLGTRNENDQGHIVVSFAIPLVDVAVAVRRNPILIRDTTELRGLRAEHGTAPGSSYANFKAGMPAIIPTSNACDGTLVENLDPGQIHNQVYGYDIGEGQEVMDLPTVRASLIAAPGVLLVATGCDGDALYVLVAGPRARTVAEYKAHWEAIRTQLPEGDRASGAESKNFSRLLPIGHDPEAWVAPEPVRPLPGADVSGSGSSRGNGEQPVEGGEVLAPVLPQTTYPLECLPKSWQTVIRAAATASGASIPTAACGFLATAAALAQVDYRCETLVPNIYADGSSTDPISLFALVVSDSGWGKSTCGDVLTAGHREADRRLADRHQEGRREMEARNDKSRSGGSGDARRPTVKIPLGTVSDVTLEAVQLRLQTGRPAVLLYNSEMGALAGSWSFSRTQLPRTLPALNTLWDGGPVHSDRINDHREIYIPKGGYAISVLLLGQPSTAAWALGETAADGFSARLLLARDDRRPVPPEPRMPEPEVRDALQAFRTLLIEQRERQDRGREFQDTKLVQEVLRLSPDAKAALLEFREEMLAVADAAEPGHARSAATRAPQLAARIAALEVAWRCYTAGDRAGHEPAPVDLAAVRTGTALARWHYHELLRVAGEMAATELSKSADTILQRFRKAEAGEVQCRQRFQDPGSGQVFFSAATVCNKCPARIRSDVEHRTSALRHLVEMGLLLESPGRRGYFRVA